MLKRDRGKPDGAGPLGGGVQLVPAVLGLEVREVGRHDVTWGIGRIIGKCVSEPALLRRQAGKELFYSRGGQFVEKGCPVVIGHVLEDGGSFVR